MTKITYTDTRFGDTFNLHLDEEDNFRVLGIERFVGNIGGDPIIYDSLVELPALYQHALSQELHAFLKRKKLNG